MLRLLSLLRMAPLFLRCQQWLDLAVEVEACAALQRVASAKRPVAAVRPRRLTRLVVARCVQRRRADPCSLRRTMPAVSFLAAEHV
jgi:hypothetical protein